MRTRTATFSHPNHWEPPKGKTVIWKSSENSKRCILGSLTNSSPLYDLCIDLWISVISVPHNLGLKSNAFNHLYTCDSVERDVPLITPPLVDFLLSQTFSHRPNKQVSQLTDQDSKLLTDELGQLKKIRGVLFNWNPPKSTHEKPRLGKTSL